jgi:hypothetical protein
MLLLLLSFDTLEYRYARPVVHDLGIGLQIALASSIEPSLELPDPPGTRC